MKMDRMAMEAIERWPFSQGRRLCQAGGACFEDAGKVLLL